MIKVTIHDQKAPLPESVARVRSTFLDEMRSDPGDQAVASAWQSDSLVALHRYSIARRGKGEEPQLILTTGPVDYATFQATSVGLDLPFKMNDAESDASHSSLREQFLSPLPPAEWAQRPLPFLANGVGVCLLLFTDDGKAVLTRRRPTAKVRPGHADVSVVEGINSYFDRDGAHSLSPYLTARRGCKEELGLDIDLDQIVMLGFGVDMAYYQWAFLGTIDARCRSAMVRQAYENHAKDRWEGALTFLPLDPTILFQSAREGNMWDLGVVTLYLALCHRTGTGPVLRAIEEVFRS